ncbi:hypothetical protein ACKWTF_000026 [Chironomus riparius]
METKKDKSSFEGLQKIKKEVPKTTSTIKSILEPRHYITSQMPYADKRYNLKEYNPPPNELGFLGGLGRKSGTMRSRAHIQRPSANQILFKMRTANRILVSFTEDLGLTNSMISKQTKAIVSPKPFQNSINDDLKVLVSRVQIADNIIKKNSKKKQASSTTSETEGEIKKPEKSVQIVALKGKKKPLRLTLGTVKKISIVSALKGEPVKPLPPDEPNNFREWALAEREKRFQALQQVSYQQIKQEREANEIFPKVKKMPKNFFNKTKNKKDLNQQFPGAEHLGGYLYGSYPKTVIDSTMENETKFHVPLSMFSRAEVESKIRASSRNKIQSARLEYMKIPQIPSDSDDESDEVLEDGIGLGLIRTPYFSIPTIYTQKKRRIDRLKNKHLNGNRLKRINMLLFDRKMSAEKNKVKYAGSDSERFSFKNSKSELRTDSPLLLRSKESSPLPMIEEKVEKVFESGYKQRYHKFLGKKYLQKLDQYNERLNKKLNEEAAMAVSPGSGVTIKTITDGKSFHDYSLETISTNFPSSTPDIQKDPAFKRQKRKVKKNLIFSKTDNHMGGFYFDPYLLEKIHNPEKGMKIMKNYTSLMRSQSNIRNRLQVNASAFDEEYCGTENTGNFYHRLVTEWDSYYINEIRHRPTVKKFCVKSDIIRIREMVRKKFFLYFMQEDLMNLYASQEIENEMINKTTKFIKACEPQFKQLQDEAFAKAKEKLELENDIIQTTDKMKNELMQLKDESDLLMQNLMCNERKWEQIMMMQNYYYLMMPPMWRLENDWIHRNRSGQLDFLKKSVVYCKKIHIRSKSITEISLHAIKEFFEKSILPKRLNHMRQINPEVSLLKASLDDIKTNVLGILNKHNEIMLRSSEISFQQQQLERTIPFIISAYQENMSHIQQKVDFIEKRIEFLIREVEVTSNLPLIKCVKNIFMRKIDAISRHLCKTLFTETFKIDESIKKHTLVENFCMISNRALDLLSQLDTLPIDILHSAEYESRVHRRDKLRLGKLAMNEQNLCQFLEKQLRNHFTPTFQPKRKRKRGKHGWKPTSTAVRMVTKSPHFGKYN